MPARRRQTRRAENRIDMKSIDEKTPESNAWHRNADRLTRWAETRIVNRRDAWGAYGRDGGTFTAPALDRRGREFLNHNRIVNHFCGRGSIGVHAISTTNTCLWIGFDIDAHNAEADPAANLMTACRIVDAANAAGLEAIVEDSNGRGGFHVWILFSEAIASDVAYRLARYIARRACAVGVECFPKQPEVTAEKRFGNWLRLPGKHHKRDHWSRFYDQATERLLGGEDAVGALLNSPVNAPSIFDCLLPVLPTTPKRVTLPVVNKGTMPACIRDLLDNSIRKNGDRNRGALTLSRYFKAAGYAEAEATRLVSEWMTRIPAKFTSSDLDAHAFGANAASVVSAVYRGAYPWSCNYVFDHVNEDTGEGLNCDMQACRFVAQDLFETEDIKPAEPELIDAVDMEVALVV